jgi:hypothetical protein
VVNNPSSARFHLPPTLRTSCILRLFGAGVMQAKGNRNKSGNNSKFRDSLAFVSKCMDEVLSESCDTDFAPCNEAEKELRGLAEKIAAYFAA